MLTGVRIATHIFKSMIDLNKFTEAKDVVLPIVQGWGQINDRKIYAPGQEDGWYLVQLPLGTIKRKASLLEVSRAISKLKSLQVYALGTEGIPLNFDNFKRRGFGEAETINFLNLPVFSVASVVAWEDGRLYFYAQILPKEQAIIRRVREAFEGRQNLLGVRGVTPELRYYFLLTDLQRQSYDALQSLSDKGKWAVSDSELSKRIASFKADFATRLEHAITNAGGTYISHSKRGNGFLVEWKVGNQTVKSEIRDDFRIVSAGFCLSGDDEKHSMNSIVQLAKMFKKNAPLYITRE